MCSYRPAASVVSAAAFSAAAVSSFAAAAFRLYTRNLCRDRDRDRDRDHATRNS